MFRQLSTTRTEGHTIGKETRRGSGSSNTCMRAGVRADVCFVFGSRGFSTWSLSMDGSDLQYVNWPGVGVPKCHSAGCTHTRVPSLLTHACVCGGWKSGPGLCNEQPGFLLVQLLLAFISRCAALKLQRSGDYSPASLLLCSSPQQLVSISFTFPHFIHLFFAYGCVLLAFPLLFLAACMEFKC